MRDSGGSESGAPGRRGAASTGELNRRRFVQAAALSGFTAGVTSGAAAGEPTADAGGPLSFEVGGEAAEAQWGPDAEGWVATVPGVVAGDTVTVPENGPVDGLGNRSGAAVALTVGSVATLDWPETMGTGGGDPPGLFGIGTFPT
ncbi:hypothetical protein [Halorientalis regularis]|uniref:Uncharacterized protein n=1 Tax=Halorientalis regularis TaxID=660518 RepID=A0A1G7HR42_9EURY|nr:hypothetical protein [Halorientalis regularis]SDF02833.1 hypothetical protein SAMN05216218_103126 [Halorientalis regularis]